MHFSYIWPRNLLKRHFKIELEKQTAKVFHFCIFALLRPLLDTLWDIFSCLWGVSALKKARFSRAWGPGTSKGGVSPCLGPLALQTYHVFSSRAPRATQKNDHLTCTLLVLGVRPSKRRPIESTITLDQPPHKLKSARKKQTNASPPLGHHTAAVWAQPTRITF